jgi:hypothetical protein
VVRQNIREREVETITPKLLSKVRMLQDSGWSKLVDYLDAVADDRGLRYLRPYVG